MLPSFSEISTWFELNSILGLGILLTVIGVIFTLSELKVYLQHKAPSEQLIFWLMALLAGIITILFNDLVLGLLTGISLLMIVETFKMLDTPVWGKLMAATTITYFVILLGRAGQVWYNWKYQPEVPDEQIFANAFNLAFPIFIIVSFIFFGRKFILVSRFSSPQIVYLFLFGVVYAALSSPVLGLRNVLFPTNEDGLFQSYNIFNIEGDWRHRVIFADFGTFEALAILTVFIYLISGWLLTVLLGVKPVEDEEILRKVQVVAKTMGITGNVKVGFVSAPILNAFAYGPFFDKRVAFISGSLDDFTDDDIKGIVGHELAHSARNHVVFLTILNMLELGIKKALLFPATALDYSFFPKESVQTITFVNYYIFSYILFSGLMIFIRIMEGDADKMTKDAGYAKELTQALFRLEGFYNGVASDLGISANLLTDRKYSLAERRRFTAQAAKGLYKDVLKPSRGSALANIFQSHPKTVYRIAALVTPDKNPRRAAFLPYRLLGFGQRKKAIKELNEVTQRFVKAIDESYLNDFGKEAIKEVLKFNPWNEVYSEYIGKNVITFNVLTQEIIVGNFEKIIFKARVTSPTYAMINGKEVDLGACAMQEYNLGSKYFLGDGTLVKLEGHSLNEENELIMEMIDADGDPVDVKFSKLGKPLSFIQGLIGEQVIHFETGLSRLKVLDSLEMDGSWDTSTITLNGDEISGKDLIVSFAPLGFETRKSFREEQFDLLSSLKNSKIMAYTKDNFDVSLSGTVQDVDEKTLTLIDADGIQTIDLDRLQYVVVNQDTIELINKKHISLFTRFGIWWSNRKEFNYILPSL